VAKTPDTSSIEQRVLTAARDVERRLDLGWMTVTHKFDPRSCAEGTIAETFVDWQYRQASIVWNISGVMALDRDDLYLTAVHEYVHVLVAPFWESVPKKVRAEYHKLMELSVENVARAIVAVWR
jgi:hypothetical protein